MRKSIKNLLSIFMIICCMTATVLPIDTAAADLPNSLYLQQEASGRCTLSSAAMMLRSRMHLCGNELWPSITESAIKSVAWSSAGLIWNWSYSIDGNRMTVGHESVSGISVSALKGILDAHPEGIVLYCKSVPHAVFLIDYEGDTFYCADTVKGYSGVKRTLANTWLGYKLGSQETILRNVSAYWYISSYSISPTNNTPAETQRPFEDVNENAYYYDAVRWAVDYNITRGCTDTTFCPSDACTRVQVVTFLWRVAGCPEPKATEDAFRDVSVASQGRFYKAIQWAKEMGITDGYKDGTFQANRSVTRAEFITMLYRANSSPAIGSLYHPFTDVDATIHEKFMNGIIWAHENGVTTGKDETHFEPDVICTRANVVAFLYRVAA